MAKLKYYATRTHGSAAHTQSPSDPKLTDCGKKIFSEAPKLAIETNKCEACPRVRRARAKNRRVATRALNRATIRNLRRPLS